MGRSALFPDGHFYSPVVDVEQAQADERRIWPENEVVPGVDLNHAGHRHLLSRWFPRLLQDYGYPEEGPEDASLDHFYERNTQFERLDARSLFCMLRMLKPRRIIEVGSGYSTLLMVDVNARFLGNSTEICSVEPYPRPFLHDAQRRGAIKLVVNRVQEVDPAIFKALRHGDILFIDSSHVSKTGSDVNWLFLHVLPSLAPGVYVHIHDIFFPSDYPRDWVIAQNRCWNEQYLLQAFLAFNAKFRIVFGSAIAARHHGALLEALGQNCPMRGGSLWIRRLPDRWYQSAAWEIKRQVARLLGRGFYRP